MKRVDVLLVEQGLAVSRTQAQAMIEAGRVSVLSGSQAQPVSKVSQKLPVESTFAIQAAASDRYVSRGALKLEGAIRQAGIEPTGWLALDLGQSTGGFSDYLLQSGVSRVIGLEVGHDQLHPRLRQDPRCLTIEGCNIRHLQPATVLDLTDGQYVDLIVCDVSFISLSLVLPPALALLKPGGHLLSLVKPQFEVGKAGLGGGGIVRDASLYPSVQHKIETLVQQAGLTVLAYFDSPITGGDGNREFFIHATRPLAA